MKYTCTSCGMEYELDELQLGQPYQCRCGKYFALSAPKQPKKAVPVILLVTACLLMAAGLITAAVILSAMQRSHITPTDIGIVLAAVIIFAMGAILAALCDISLQLRRRA